MLSRQEIDTLRANLDKLSTAEQQEVLEAIEELERREHIKRCQDDFLEFCLHMDPEYKVGAHHRKLSALLMSMETGQTDRIGVSVPPRHGKSHMISTLFPAWYLGRHPTQQIMLVSHTADLAVDFGRKVRNLISSVKYGEIFPNVSLSADSKSAGRWNTNHGGQFYATGVGSALAGRGAHCLIIDDPFSEQDVLNGNYSVFDKAYEWFTFGARTRLMKGGRIAVVHCLTGDTKVLMADGVEKPIRDVRPGDMVASYDNNSVVQARVLNWANQGLDRIYSIRMNSGVIIRGNGKHPLLVDDNGEHKWVTIKTLKPGMQLVSIQGAPTRQETSCPVLSVKAATTKSCYRTRRGGLLKNLLSTLCTSALRKVARNHQKTRQNQITVRHVTPESGTTQRTPTPPGCHSGTTVNGKVRYVQLRVVNLLYMLRGCAARVWIKRITDYVKKQVQLTARKGAAIRTSKLGMVLQGPNTTACLPSKQGSVRYVANHPMKGILPRNGVREGLQLIIATLLGKLGHFCATHVTSLSKTATLSSYLKQPLNTLSTTTQTIIEITHDGYEDVFDIQVEGTETFIANGVVSHNTRWHPSDLIGRLAKDMATKEGVDQYEFFEFPAILNEDTDNEKALWPEFFNLDALHRTKASMPLFQWNAQYQQNPTGEAGAIVRRDSWRRWEGESPPVCEYLIMALDAAAEKTNRSDFTAMTVWGVFSHDVLTQGANHIILLHATNERLEFPDLKRLAFERYTHWQPDCFIVERKSNGIPLYQELRRAGVPVQEFTPSRASGDKIMRLNAVADIFRSGMVWYPAGKRWAEEVVEQVAAFPEVEHDDLVDTVSMALARFRQGGFIRLPSDYEDEPVVRMPRYAGYY